MSFTHYYYAINRKAAERVFDLTWNQFLDKYGWSKRSQWQNIGGYFEFGLDKPELSDEPTSEEIAPILRRTIRETLRHMSPEYYCILELSYHLGKRSFVKSDIGAEGLEEDLDGLNACAVWAFLYGDIDASTLWCVFTLHEEWSSDLFDRIKLKVTEKERRRIHAAIRRFGRCRPIFDWQRVSAVRDGHTALGEEDTRRFVQFVRLAWGHNWPVYSNESRLLHFRDFKLARKLHRACPKFLGNCLVHYWGN